MFDFLFVQLVYYSFLSKYHYYLVDFLLGIVTFGVVFVISYMMFCFTKKRRAVEDYFGKSVVIDKKQSSWFKNKEEEEQIKMYDGDVLLWKIH